MTLFVDILVGAACTFLGFAIGFWLRGYQDRSSEVSLPSPKPTPYLEATLFPDRPEGAVREEYENGPDWSMKTWLDVEGGIVRSYTIRRSGDWLYFSDFYRKDGRWTMDRWDERYE